MSRITMSRIMPLAVTILIAATGPAFAAQASGSEPSKQSGTIVSVDGAARTLTLEEMGPWHGPKTALNDCTIVFAPSTRVELITRANHATPEGWRGGYVKSPLSFDQLRPGDFATVALTHQGDRVVATSLDVVRPTSSK
jgi:hypothetical protein